MVTAAVTVCIGSTRAGTFTVTNTSDADPGSLRQAISAANADATTPRLIDFAIPGTGVQTITLASALPQITRVMTIDGTTQPGYGGNPLVTIDGNSGDYDGLVVNFFLSGNGAPTSIKGLCIINCGAPGGTPRHGINLTDSDGAVTVTGCFLGIQATGTTAGRNTGSGIFCAPTSDRTWTIGGTTSADRCVISGNLGSGVDAQARSLTVIGNYIGTSSDGLSQVPNGGDGIFITNQGLAKIGTATAGSGNVISGNNGNGVRALVSATLTNNIIGLSANGTDPLGNTLNGVAVDGSTTHVDGDNVVSANGNNGVRVNTTAAFSFRCTVIDNHIGTDSTGTLARGNGSHGVDVVRGSAAVSRNVISGNTGYGVHVNTGDGLISGNTIGTNEALTAPLANGGGGIWNENVPNLGITGNTIAANNGPGVKVSGTAAVGGTITGNTIGVSGTPNLGNAGPGISIGGGAAHQVIGSNLLDSNLNTIRFNTGPGVEFDSCNRVLFNSIFGNGGSALEGGTFSPATITAVKATGFPDARDLDVSVDDPLNPSANLTLFFFLNDVQDQNTKTPVGLLDITSDVTGKASGSVRVTGPFDAIQFLTTYTVTDRASNPNTSCTSRVSIGTSGGGEPPPPPVTLDKTAGNHLFAHDMLEPVSTFSGELFELESVDLDLRGPLPLSFARYYASNITSDGNISSSLGRSRLHNFDAKLTVDGANLEIILNNGRVVQFTKMGNQWELAGRKDVAFQLVENAGNFTLADPGSQQMWTFDGSGKLTMIEDGRGNSHLLTYTGTQLTSVSDGLGRTLSFGYGAGDQLTSVTDGTRTVTFGYNGVDLTTATNPLNLTTTYIYDASGRLISTQRPRGNSPFSQTYDSGGRVVTQSENPGGTPQTYTLSYDSAARTTTIRDPAAQTRVDTHTATGELTAITDEAGKVIAIGSDAATRRSTITDQLGRKKIITYHTESGKPESIISEDGATVSIAYKSRETKGIKFYDLSKITFPDGTAQSFTYDPKGNVTTASDQFGKKSKFTYNARGQLLTAVNPTGGTTTYTYDAKGNLATRVDSDAGIGTTSYTYDAFNRLARVTHPDNTHFDLAYDDADRITRMTDQRGGVSSFTYDANSNVIVALDPNGATFQFTYDGLDRVKTFTDRLGKLSSRAFDPRNLLASETDSLNHTTIFTHDERRRVSSVAEPGNAQTTFGYDDLGQLTSITDPLGHKNTLSRNRRGSVIAATDALGHTALVERDTLQRIVRKIDPIGRATTFTYDKRGLLETASRDGGEKAVYTRNAAGRLVKITDANGATWGFTYSPMGRLTSSRDPIGNLTRIEYDAQGRLSKINLPDAATCSLQRDAAGNLSQLNFSSGPTIDFQYDTIGRLIGTNGVVLTRDGEGRVTNSFSGGLNHSATYDDAGRLITAGYNNGAVIVSYTYDANDRITAVSDNLSGATVGFTYDAAGRVTAVTRSNGVNASLTYDDADRIARIQEGTIVDLKYSLNNAGDIVSTDFTAPLVPSITEASRKFAYDAASQVKGAGYAYDKLGRLTAMPEHTLKWDGASRLVSFDSTTLVYNGLGDVVTRTTGTSTSTFFYHYALGGHPLAAERDDSLNQFTRYYVWTPGGRLLYSIDAVSHVPSFYHGDVLGSTLALTDATGAVTDQYAYSSYGELLSHEATSGHSPSTQPFTFVGAYGIRAEDSIYQMRARYYDPVTARFLSRDPAGPRLSDPRTLNHYLYALGNPTRYIDPSGAVETSMIGNADFGIFFAQTFTQPFVDKLDAEEYGETATTLGHEPYSVVKTKVEPPDLERTGEIFGEKARTSGPQTFEDFLEANPSLVASLSIIDVNGIGEAPPGEGLDVGPPPKASQLASEALDQTFPGALAPAAQTLRPEVVEVLERLSPGLSILDSNQPAARNPENVANNRGDKKSKPSDSLFGLFYDQFFGKGLGPKKFKKALANAIEKKLAAEREAERQKKVQEELKKSGITPK